MLDIRPRKAYKMRSVLITFRSRRGRAADGSNQAAEPGDRMLLMV